MSNADHKQKTPPLSGRKPRTPKRVGSSIKKDAIHPSDWLKYPMAWSCEDCVHFAPQKTECTLGFNPIHHLRETQIRSYELSGKIAFCRFQEIT